MAIPFFTLLLAGGLALGSAASAGTDIGGPAAGDSAANPAKKLPAPLTVDELRLEKAARDYRIQTYETFRTDRAEYDRRQAEGVRLQTAWTEAGKSADDQPKLIDWFAQATASSRAEEIGDLPPFPQFTIVPHKNEAETKLTDTKSTEKQSPDSTDAAAAKIDGLLHVKPVSSPAAATDSSPPMVAPTTSAASLPHKSSLIGSLPNAFGAEISRTLDGLSGKSKTNAPSQGR